MASTYVIDAAPIGIAVIVIGDEVVSGATTDINGPRIAKRLSEAGLNVREIVAVPDDVAAIADAVRRASATRRWVVTSGGLGSTHDDVTASAIAKAFGRELQSNQDALLALRNHHSPSDVPCGRLASAELPEGAAALPAFSKLFVETESQDERQAILCTRRRRAPDEPTPWMFHLLIVAESAAREVSYETDRLRFIGRGRTTADPQALDDYESGGSAPCFMHEFGPDGAPGVEPRQARDVASWRTAERERLIAARLALSAEYRAGQTLAIEADLDGLISRIPVRSSVWTGRSGPSRTCDPGCGRRESERFASHSQSRWPWLSR